MLGVVEGTAPPYGYGHGAAQFRYEDSALPGTSYPQVPYPAQMYGRDTQAQLHDFRLGDFTDTIKSIVGGISSAATSVENIARGVATGAQATNYVVGRAASGGGQIFQPSPADIAAKQADVAALLGGSAFPYVIIGGGLLALYLLGGRRR